MGRRSYQDDGLGGGPQMQLAYPALTPAVKWLLIVNVALFLVCFLLPAETYERVLHWLAFDPRAWREQAPLVPLWQLLSYGFLHSIGGVGHIFFNMLTLYFFGLMLEQEFGTRRFLITYFGAQVTGGVFFLALALATGSDPVLLGASGGCFGVMVASAVLWPRRPVLLYFVPVTLRTMALIFVGIEVFLMLVALKGGPSDGVSHVTHLGGIVSGFLAARTGFVRW